MTMTNQQRQIALKYIEQWRIRGQRKRLLEAVNKAKPLVGERELELSRILLSQVSQSYGKAV